MLKLRKPANAPSIGFDGINGVCEIASGVEHVFLPLPTPSSSSAYVCYHLLLQHSTKSSS